jgi:hypothetical protein
VEMPPRRWDCPADELNRRNSLKIAALAAVSPYSGREESYGREMHWLSPGGGCCYVRLGDRCSRICWTGTAWSHEWLCVETPRAAASRRVSGAT